MESGRRDFLKGTLWMGATAALAGCFTAKSRASATMSGFAARPIRRLRIGFVGLGKRGPGAVHRLSAIPGVEVAALCDLLPERVEAQRKWLAENCACLNTPRAYSGEEGYKALCESDLDLVYIVTPWKLHVPMALYALEHGKHAAVEVPAAMTVEDCWALVETAERTRLHCMQLENCCYGEVEMLSLSMARSGALGEIVHGEGGYIHDLRELSYLDERPEDRWRLDWYRSHTGNPYPTHGLLPIMQAMNVNRGDRFDYLTSVSSAQVGMEAFARAKFGDDSWQAKDPPRCGDMSTTVIRTVGGRTVTVQHDVTSPRPYSRINRLVGTMGSVCGYPLRMALCERAGGGAHSWFSRDRTDEMSEKYRHPLWRDAGEIAKKVGGHGGMDFLMDLRLAYCLENGLPLDMDVYDLASSCAVVELSERSALDRGNSRDVPDFTRGGWRTAKPLGLETVDIARIGISEVKKDKAALDV